MKMRLIVIFSAFWPLLPFSLWMWAKLRRGTETLIIYSHIYEECPLSAASVSALHIFALVYCLRLCAPLVSAKKSRERASARRRRTENFAMRAREQKAIKNLSKIKYLSSRHFLLLSKAAAYCEANRFQHYYYGLHTEWPERERGSSRSEDQTCYVEWDDEKFQHLTERSEAGGRRGKFSFFAHFLAFINFFDGLLDFSRLRKISEALTDGVWKVLIIVRKILKSSGACRLLKNLLCPLNLRRIVRILTIQL